MSSFIAQVVIMFCQAKADSLKTPIYIHPATSTSGEICLSADSQQLRFSDKPIKGAIAIYYPEGFWN